MSSRARNLDIEQDEAFERRSFIVECAGRMVMTVIVAAAAAGLLGSGPLARATAAAPGNFTVEYANAVLERSGDHPARQGRVARATPP